MESVVEIGGYFLRAADPAALSTWYRENLNRIELWQPAD